MRKTLIDGCMLIALPLSAQENNICCFDQEFTFQDQQNSGNRVIGEKF